MSKTKDQVLGVVRHVLTSGGGLAVGGSVATQDEVSAIAGGLVALVGVIWSWFSKKKG